MPSAVQRSLVSDQVFRALAHDLLTGRYGPGELLPTQRQLARDLDVNMASVREAVKRLEQLRLVESRQGDGMRVRDWRTSGGLDVVAHVLFRAGGLDRATLSAVLEARRLMLSEAAGLAAERRSEEQAARLEEIAERLGAAETEQAAQSLDFAFFAEMVEASGNLVLVLVMNSIRQIYFERAELFRAVVTDHAKLAPSYRRAARAVTAGAAGRAAAAVRALAEAQESRLLRSLPA